MLRSWSIALQGFVLLEDLPASPLCFGLVKHYGLFYLFPLQAADLDGEIDLSTCYDVTEYPVQRNYGFQIHVRKMWGRRKSPAAGQPTGLLMLCRCLGMLVHGKGTSPQTPKGGHLASPTVLRRAMALGLRDSFLVHKKWRGKGKALSQPEGLSYGKTSLIAEKC